MQLDTALDLNEWISSPEQQSPKQGRSAPSRPQSGQTNQTKTNGRAALRSE